MTGEDQEHFADYLELENYVEDLQAERAAHLPTNLTAEQARVYRMATLFHSTSPEVSKASQPRPEFIAALGERLLSISQEQEAEVSTQEEAPIPVHQMDQEQSKNQQAAIQQPWQDPEASTPPEHLRKTRSVSRRGLLAGGAAAAASLAVGIGAGTMMHQPQPPQPPSYKQENLIPSGPTTWLLVAPLAQLSTQAVKFATDAFIYYVRLNNDDDDDDDKNKDVPHDPAIAVLATCTHMGCIVNWDGKNQQFQCPCHSGLFDEYGQPAKESPMRYLKPLPRLRTKIENGNVYIEVPANPSSPTNKRN
ncbi:MAG TPA: Rieske 2Fe-2S domain-containing protein [Ktedonobacteraceae bacterium]